ncbi:Peptidylprolyl isomerase [Rasamsonia emersonii CBS 393.64]|uniref:FK506-binding protein n=1 Tax=Rasamsonia emersonii (strain ATCC 16479 / CBS 393.64 / IMI 116815) TaxID=1408163 RepID=A0A0F4YTG2_RASE3|nr:Peptidylprolyl isomerase [Rasamsonia emersonii CBS 393.64]KKA21534.1 Peptidylprolyl isomerase [Rasamsonia emersonii CBS 393.64]
MSGVQPVAVYALQVPPGGGLVPAVPDSAAMFRVSMAAIDPDAAPEYEDDYDSSKPPRATLKIVRPPPGMDMDEDDDDYEDESDEDSEDEEINGGPSDKEKAKKLREAAARKEMEDAMDEDDSDGAGEEVDMKSAISKLIKGKAPAKDGDDDDDDESLDLEEIVVCTLDPEKPLDITVSENERIYFKVTGTHTVYLTGNYVMPTDEGRRMLDDEDEEDDEDEYDLSPDEDELDMDLIDEDEESDELDDLENPRITEINSDEEEEAPKLVTAPPKGKNKRPAEDEAGLDDMMAKDAKSKPNGEANLSKKQQKKLKKNNGEAAPVEEKKDAKDGKDGKDAPAKSDKKVQFAKNLEQGPTGSAQDKKSSEKTTGTLGVKEVQGVKIDDKKLGKGPVAKNGNTVSMRYIGKLEDGKVFDANKKGKPFTFKLGKGEVIKGWDIGVAGMAAGGERRIIIPPHLGYGKKAMPGIPPNSKLIFDVKLLEIK